MTALLVGNWRFTRLWVASRIYRVRRMILTSTFFSPPDLGTIRPGSADSLGPDLVMVMEALVRDPVPVPVRDTLFRIPSLAWCRVPSPCHSAGIQCIRLDVTFQLGMLRDTPEALRLLRISRRGGQCAVRSSSTRPAIAMTIIELVLQDSPSIHKSIPIRVPQTTEGQCGGTL